jgi:hypothetical protein
MADLARALPRPRLPSLPAWQALRRRLVLAALVLAALFAGYMLWFRDSSLVAVENVTVNGAESAPAAESALRAAAQEQSTLHLDLAALEEAVASEPAVRSVSATTDFPHGLTVFVELREPVGFLRSEGAVIAGDGVVLERTGTRPKKLPVIELGEGRGGVGGGSATGDALRTARVLGAAPAPLLELVGSAGVDPDLGIVVEIGPGPELRFGDASSAAQKWLAAAAILASPNFEGAAYLDLHVPSRPVAGGIPDLRVGDGVEEAAAAAEAAAAPPGADPTAVAPEAVPAPVGPDPVAPAAPAAPATGAEAEAEAGGGVTLE